MLLNEEDYELTKRYYTIGEVANLFGLSRSVIRNWESEFDNLRPHKNSRGDRLFTKQNIEQLRLIYELVRERGFTLAGARQEIERLRAQARERDRVVERLKELRRFLEELRYK